MRLNPLVFVFLSGCWWQIPGTTVPPTTTTTQTTQPTTTAPPQTSAPSLMCVVEPTASLASCISGTEAVGDGVAFSTIQQAIDSGASVVDICPGTYPVALELPDLITLQSASGDATDTILQGGPNGTIVEAMGGVILNNLTLQQGYSTYEAGALTSSSYTELLCSRFINNTADYGGGAVHARGDLLIESSSFEGNYADYEGGAVSWGDWDDGSLTILNSVFENNEAAYSGGAIEIGTWAYDTVEITGSSFINNQDGYSDGVISFGSWGGFDAIIDSCEFIDNDVALGVNGWLLDGYNMSVTNTSFVGEAGVW